MSDLVAIRRRLYRQAVIGYLGFVWPLRFSGFGYAFSSAFAAAKS